MKEFELESGEHVVMQVRKHWLLLVTSMVPYAILAIIPFAMPTLLKLTPVFAPYASYFEATDALGRAVRGVWLLAVWTGAWSSFTRYYLNLWVLTNHRIVEIEQRNYFSRQVSSMMISRLQDVTTDVHGIIPSLFGFGTIKAQSAGADAEFRMSGIPRPEQMRDLIMRYVSLGTQKTSTP